MIIKFVSFMFLWQGSDPRKNASINPNYSVRGKLQTRRCKLNKEINKELRLRAGAENLYKVSKKDLVISAEWPHQWHTIFFLLLYDKKIWSIATLWIFFGIN